MKSSFRVNASSASLGVLGSLPLFACGLLLETRRDWEWVRTAQATTERVVLKLFGSKRQVISSSFCRRLARVRVEDEVSGIVRELLPSR